MKASLAIFAILIASPALVHPRPMDDRFRPNTPSIAGSPAASAYSPGKLEDVFSSPPAIGGFTPKQVDEIYRSPTASRYSTPGGPMDMSSPALSADDVEEIQVMLTNLSDQGRSPSPDHVEVYPSELHTVRQQMTPNPSESRPRKPSLTPKSYPPSPASFGLRPFTAEPGSIHADHVTGHVEVAEGQWIRVSFPRSLLSAVRIEGGSQGTNDGLLPSRFIGEPNGSISLQIYNPKIHNFYHDETVIVEGNRFVTNYGVSSNSSYSGSSSSVITNVQTQTDGFDRDSLENRIFIRPADPPGSIPSARVSGHLHVDGKWMPVNFPREQLSAVQVVESGAGAGIPGMIQGVLPTRLSRKQDGSISVQIYTPEVQNHFLGPKTTWVGGNQYVTNHGSFTQAGSNLASSSSMVPNVEHQPYSFNPLLREFMGPFNYPPPPTNYAVGNLQVDVRRNVYIPIGQLPILLENLSQVKVVNSGGSKQGLILSHIRGAPQQSDDALVLTGIVDLSSSSQIYSHPPYVTNFNQMNPGNNPYGASGSGQ